MRQEVDRLQRSFLQIIAGHKIHDKPEQIALLSSDVNSILQWDWIHYAKEPIRNCDILVPPNLAFSDHPQQSAIVKIHQ